MKNIRVLCDLTVLHKIKQLCANAVEIRLGVTRALNRSKKRIKGQNFCQTIEDLSFHRFTNL